MVYSTNACSALKAFKDRIPYERELAVYKRLQELKISEIRGFNVPKYISSDDDLMVLQISTIRPPFVVDFASAGLDRPLFEYSQEVVQEWLAERKELFGDRWPEVLRILSGFRKHGIFLSDVKPGNITFE